MLNQIVSNQATDNDTKVQELYKFYQERVFEELKSLHKKQIEEKLKEELNDYKCSLYETQLKKAQLIMSKYELLTREYQGQNKSFTERHDIIINNEKKRRDEIISNFENHLTQIKKQMREENDSMANNNEIAKENQMLQEKYDDLVKEIEEKSQIMDTQLSEKEKTSGQIEEDMQQKIASQEEEIKKQIQVYKEQTEIKIGEEKELIKVFNDYKAKYDEFDKALKKSRETFKRYETEIKNMNKRIQVLEQEKKQLSSDKKKGKG